MGASMTAAALMAVYLSLINNFARPYVQARESAILTGFCSRWIPCVKRVRPGQQLHVSSMRSIRLHKTWAERQTKDLPNARSSRAALAKDFIPDTIFAISSGQGRAGVAIIRTSGPHARHCLERLLQGNRPSAGKEQLPAPRMASVRGLFHPITGEHLDQAIVLWFKGPRSFTGEDTVEFHVHGSRAVVNGVMEALISLDGVRGEAESRIRPAEAGEFTERAFANGRMDLTEVEGLADLIAADTPAQRRQALRQVAGSLKETYEGWRDELKHCLAHTEAVIDFGEDENDVSIAAYDTLRPRVENLRQAMQAHLADNNRGEIIRSGIRVAIVGPPNAGKSTLLNILARRPAAIVSPVAGTTRDVVEVQLELAGLPVVVSDTAGVRAATVDPIEIEGIRRTRQAAEQASLTLIVLDVSHALDEAALRALRNIGLFPSGKEPQDLSGLVQIIGRNNALMLILNKEDIFVECHSEEQLISAGPFDGSPSYNTPGYLVSCNTGKGIDAMLEGLESRLSQLCQRAAPDGLAEVPMISRARHRYHVSKCLEALATFMEDERLGLDTAAEELRMALTELGKITGAVDVEEVLSVIFADFCIGK